MTSTASTEGEAVRPAPQAGEADESACPTTANTRPVLVAQAVSPVRLDYFTASHGRGSDWPIRVARFSGYRRPRHSMVRAKADDRSAIEPDPRGHGDPHGMHPGVAFEPRFVLGEACLGEGRAIQAFEHSRRKLRDERPLRQAISTDGRNDGRGHAAAIEDVGDQGGPPEARGVEPHDGHLAADPAEECGGGGVLAARA